MIEEMLKKIREAEENADSVRADADEKSREIRSKADADYARVVEEAKRNARAKRESEISSVRAFVATKSATEIEEARIAGDKTVMDNESRAVELANELYGRILNGDI